MKQHFVKYKYWYISSAIFLLMIWYLIIYKKSIKLIVEKNLPIEPSEPRKAREFPTIDWTKANDEFPLKYGSKGDKVKSLQTWLVNVGGAKLENGIDGKFGKETELALIAFKQRDNISQDYWDKIGLNVYMGGIAKI